MHPPKDSKHKPTLAPGRKLFIAELGDLPLSLCTVSVDEGGEQAEY